MGILTRSGDARMTRLPTIRSAADIAKWCRERHCSISLNDSGVWSVRYIQDEVDGYFTFRNVNGRTAQSAIRKAEKQLKRTK